MEHFIIICITCISLAVFSFLVGYEFGKAKGRCRGYVEGYQLRGCVEEYIKKNCAPEEG